MNMIIHRITKLSFDICGLSLRIQTGQIPTPQPKLRLIVFFGFMVSTILIMIVTHGCMICSTVEMTFYGLGIN